MKVFYLEYIYHNYDYNTQSKGSYYVLSNTQNDAIDKFMELFKKETLENNVEYEVIHCEESLEQDLGYLRWSCKVVYDRVGLLLLKE